MRPRLFVYRCATATSTPRRMFRFAKRCAHGVPLAHFENGEISISGRPGRGRAVSGAVQGGTPPSLCPTPALHHPENEKAAPDDHGAAPGMPPDDTEDGKYQAHINPPSLCAMVVLGVH